MKATILTVMAILVSTISFAREYQGELKTASKGNGDGVAANCAPPVDANAKFV